MHAVAISNDLVDIEKNMRSGSSFIVGLYYSNY